MENDTCYIDKETGELVMTGKLTMGEYNPFKKNCTGRYYKHEDFNFNELINTTPSIGSIEHNINIIK